MAKMKKALSLLALVLACGMLPAQSITNVRVEQDPTLRYYKISFDLSGNPDELYFIKAVPYREGRELNNPRYLTGKGIAAPCAPGKSLQIFWDPVLDGREPEGWQFRISALPMPLNEVFPYELVPQKDAYKSSSVNRSKHKIVLEGGVGIPQDDIEGTNKMKGAWALSWDAWMIKDWLGIGFSVWFANVEVNGYNPNDSYSSSLEGINLYLKLRPTKAGSLNFFETAFIRRISPFVALGGGWSTHGSLDENGVADNPSIQPGFRGHFSLPHAAAGITFLSKWNTTLDLGVKYDHFTKDSIDLAENAGNYLENDALITRYIGLGLTY